MNWESICYVLKPFGIESSACAQFKEAHNFLLLEEEVLDDPNTAYICVDHVPGQKFRKSLIISTHGRKTDSDNYICLREGTPAAVFNALMLPDSNLRMLDDLLKETVSDQEIIDIASSCLGTPLFYFDESYRILAITGNILLENDPEWRYMTEQRSLSPESVRHMQENGDLDMLAKETGPVYYDTDLFPFSCIVTNIRYQNVPYGRLNRLCLNGKLNPVMKEECSIIARNLLRLLNSRKNLPLSGSTDSMICDLLNGLPLSETLIRERLLLRHRFSGKLLRLCLIDVNSGADVHVPSYYSALLGRLYDEKSAFNLIYQNSIVLLLCSDTEKGFEPGLNRLGSFLEKQNVRAGISDIFLHFTEIRTGYGQACEALGFARGTEAVFFEDIFIDHLISYVPDEKRGMFSSYALDKLASVQPDYSFPLIETLKVYLECGCSLKESSARLFIHKNSMLYRISKIKDIIGQDLEDPQTRTLLTLSLKISPK